MKPTQSIKRVDWNEQFKIRQRRNASIKHEIIKMLIVRNLQEKFKKNLYWIRIYTEYGLEDKKICDVYFENIKTNEIICYEIQKKITKEWLKNTNEFYKNYSPLYFSVDWVLIKEKELSNDVIILNEEIKTLII